MKNRFLHRDAKLTYLSKARFIIGIFLGIFFSVTFYSFLYVIRETFRVLSVSETYEMWILSDSEVHFYNLFFAFISVIFGQSICFVFLFNSPKRLFANLHIRNSSIVNSQSAVNCYFLSWFSKLALVFGLYFGFIIKGGYNIFSLYPNYWYIFVLIIIFLFYQTWNTIRVQFKQRSVKWFLVSVLTVSLFAIGLSRVNVINYKAINSIVQSKNIHSKYILDIPEAKYYTRIERLSLVEHIFVVQEKNQSSVSEPIIIIDNQVVTIDDLNSILKQWQSERDESEIPFMTYCLHIDKTVPMEFFNKLKKEFFKLKIYKFSFAITPENPEFDKRYYQDFITQFNLPDFENADSIVVQSIVNSIKQIKNVIEIRYVGDDNYKVNDMRVSEKQLSTQIYNLISANSDYLIKLYISDCDLFLSFFKMHESSLKSVFELRNTYSKETYQTEFERLDSEKMMYVKELFPLKVLDMTNQMLLIDEN